MSTRNFLFKFKYKELKEIRGTFLRSIVYSLLISHNIRRNSNVYILLEGVLSNGLGLISLNGATIRYLRPDESSSWGILRKSLKALKRMPKLRKREVISPHYGVNVYTLSKVKEILQIIKPVSASLIISDEREEHNFPFVIKKTKEDLLIIFNMSYSRFSCNEIRSITQSTGEVIRLCLKDTDLTLDQAVAVINWLLDEYCEASYE